MSVLSVIHGALISPEAMRAGGSEELAQIVADALRDASMVTPTTDTCRVLFALPTGRLARCTESRRHAGAHVNGTTSWTDDQAAGVLRERI